MLHRTNKYQIFSNGPRDKFYIKETNGVLIRHVSGPWPSLKQAIKEAKKLELNLKVIIGGKV